MLGLTQKTSQAFLYNPLVQQNIVKSMNYSFLLIFSDFQQVPISPYYYFVISTGYSKIERVLYAKTQIGILTTSPTMSVSY